MSAKDHCQRLATMEPLYFTKRTLCTRLYHLQQTLDGQLDRLFLVHGVFVVLFEKLSHSLT